MPLTRKHVSPQFVSLSLSLDFLLSYSFTIFVLYVWQTKLVSLRYSALLLTIECHWSRTSPQVKLFLQIFEVQLGPPPGREPWASQFIRKFFLPVFNLPSDRRAQNNVIGFSLASLQCLRHLRVVVPLHYLWNRPIWCSGWDVDDAVVLNGVAWPRSDITFRFRCHT